MDCLDILDVGLLLPYLLSSESDHGRSTTNFLRYPLLIVGYLLLQLEAIISIVPMVSVKFAILIFVPLEGLGLDFLRPLHKLFIFDLHEHLSYRSIERR